MDLHEHLKLARSKIKPLTKEQRVARARKAVQVRWKKWKAEHKNPTRKSTSAPRITEDTEE